MDCESDRLRLLSVDYGESLAGRGLAYNTIRIKLSALSNSARNLRSSASASARSIDQSPDRLARRFKPRGEGSTSLN